MNQPIFLARKQLHFYDENLTINDGNAEFNLLKIDSVFEIKNHQPASPVNIAKFYLSDYDLLVMHKGSSYYKICKYQNNKGVLNIQLMPFEEAEIFNSKSQKYLIDDIKAKNYELADTLEELSLAPRRDLILDRQYHIYVDQTKIQNNYASFSFEEIQETQIVERKNRNGIITGITLTSVIGALSLSFGLGFGLACGCPHNYMYNGENYVYSSTLFTGAAHQKLERNDYKIIPDYNPHSAEIDLLIKNEMDEIQYTNLVELWVVEHDSSSQIAVDQQGVVYACSNEIMPIECSNGSRQDLLPLIQYRDEATYDFDALSKNQFSEVFLRFTSPKKKENPKLILKLKNQMWGKFVFDQFSALFGDWHSNWQEKKRKQSEKKVKKEVVESGLLLTVAIKTQKGWETIETIELQGDISFNTLAVPIDSKWILEKDLEIRLQSGFKFWNLDYVALDTNQQKNLSIQKVQAENVPKSLQKDDDDYLIHQKGDEQKLSFKNLKSNQNRTLIMHSKGYYLTTKTYSGKTAISTLLKINNKGGLSWYSWYLFDQLLTAERKN